MAKNAVKVQDYPDDMDTLPAAAGVTEPVYEVEAGELMHHEIQALATEVGLEKQAASTDTSTLEKQIAELENKLEAEKNRRKYLAEVEAKVTRLIPEPTGYRTRMDNAAKLDEANIKLYEDQLAASEKAEARYADAKRIEAPKKEEAKRAEAK